MSTALNVVKCRAASSSLDKILENARKASLNDAAAAIFQAMYQDIGRIQDNFVEANLVLQSSKNTDDLEEYRRAYDVFFERFYEIKVIYNQLWPVKSESKAEATNMLLPLPKIELLKFDGCYSEWQSFISMFQTMVHGNASLSNVQKLHYLVSCLKGEALSMIKHLPLSADNYNIAFSLLMERYNNPRRIADMHLAQILDVPALTAKTSLRQFINTIQENHQALAAFIAVDGLSFVLLHVVLRKLTVELRTEFERQHAQFEFPTFFHLVTFLNAECRALEAVGDSLLRSKISRSSRGVNALVTTSTSSQCALCKGSHSLSGCARFVACAPDQRWLTVRQLFLCFNCLSPGHGARSCPSKFTCRECKARHNTLLHGKGSGPHREEMVRADVSDGSGVLSAAATVDANTVGTVSSTTVLLSTVLAEAARSDGRFIMVRLLLDSASQGSFITEACRRRLGWRCARGSIPVHGVGQMATWTQKGRTGGVVRPRGHGEPRFEIECIVLNQICADLPSRQVNAEAWRHISNLNLADPGFATPSPIDILLGADIFPLVLRDGRIPGGLHEPSAINTMFGWVLMGRTLSTAPSVVNTFVSTLEPSLESVLHRFWEAEEFPVAEVGDPEDEQCERHFVETHERVENGRFMVRLPFKHGPNDFGDSYYCAERRFLSLERRLARDSELKLAYALFLEEYETLGHMRQVDVVARGMANAYFIPHHGILKESSSTTKLRVVFDASMTSTSGVSLNDILLAGPKLQQNIVDVVLRFRLHKVVFTADIKKMYRQVLVHPEDRKFQVILWRSSIDKPVLTYELNTVTYGVKAAPFLAMRCLRQLAQEHQADYPEASRIIREDIFVDDIVSGATSIEQAFQLKRQVVDLLRFGCFELRKWSSNCPELLADLPQDHCETPLAFQPEGDDVVKILGVTWSPTTDRFMYHAILENRCCTKRGILSNIARIYDPCGWLSPVTFLAKAMMQELWLLGLQWDETPPQQFVRRWQTFMNDFHMLANLSLPRHLLLDGAERWQLHGFSDASEKGYAAVVYVRVTDKDGCVTLHLVLAKSKVAPIKQRLTIPRLELCGAVLLARLLNHVSAVIGVQPAQEETVAWCDSTIVLAWVRTPPHTLHMYEGNRVSKVQELIGSRCWRHVPTGMNPADIASRGTLPGDFIHQKNWWNPVWLAAPPQEWPSDCRRLEEAQLPGVRAPKTLSLTTTVQATNDVLFRYSDLAKLLTTTGWCLRFKFNATHPQAKRNGPLSYAELTTALHVWVKFVQRSAFCSDIQLLQANKQCGKSVARLNPVLDECGMLRVGGRLQHSGLPVRAKCPLLLPHTHHLTDLIIDCYHRRYLHAGPNLLKSILHREFWILSARRAIRSRLFKCNRCFRLKAAPVEPYMADLPPSRVRRARPFLRVGVDFGGPFLIKSSKLRSSKVQKAYLSVFVCFATKAVHLEVVSDLSTDAFIAAFTRFTTRRGLCTDVYSDSATNFQGASRYLRDLRSASTTSSAQDQIKYAFRDRGVVWHFNPPSAPHFGGIHEAAVKSAKSHLKRVVGTQILTFEELSTLFCQIEAVLNSRPLCAMSADPTELEALTPGHFLIGEPLVAVPEADLREVTLNRLSRWQLLQQMSQHFWKRWLREYLHTLQHRPKWLIHHANLKVDDIVLLKEDNVPPLHWRLGRIVKVHPGADATVRVVTLRTAQGLLTRPVVKLCLLPGN